MSLNKMIFGGLLVSCSISSQAAYNEINTAGDVVATPSSIELTQSTSTSSEVWRQIAKQATYSHIRHPYKKDDAE